MKTIETLEELRRNLSILETYLTEGNDDESDYASSLIKNGMCFVAYKIKNEWRFAPSRFIGYANNSIQLHKNNDDKDGKETNPAIEKLADASLGENNDLEKKFLTYCSDLGINPKNNHRKYWIFDFGENDFIENELLNDEFPEGKIVERKHKIRERSVEVVNAKKKLFQKTHNHLFCELCGFDFHEKYGDIGKKFIEAHHTIPVSEMKDGHKTKLEDLVLLCSNCHRMIHRRRPWLRINELKKLIVR